MSRSAGPLPVLIWSPSRIEVFLPATEKTVVGETIAAVRSSIPGRRVLLALSRRVAFMRTTHVPDASKADVAKVLAMQLGGLFPVSPEDAAIDFALTEVRGPEGRVALVAAVPASTLKQVYLELAGADLEAEAVVPLALGSAALVRSAGQSSALVVEDTGDGWGIDVVENGVLRLSRETGSGAIGEEIERTRAIAKMPSAPVITESKLDLDQMIPASRSVAAILAAQPALGLNLELPELVAQREQKRNRGRQRVLLFLWVAVVALAAVIWDQRDQQAQRIAERNRQNNAALKRLRDSLALAEGQVKELQAVDDVLDRGFGGKQPLVDVATLFSNFTPKGLWLTGVNLERGKLATVRGTATNGDLIPKYLDRLGSQSRFRDVKLVFSNNGLIEEVPVVNFSVSAHVVGNFPMTDPNARRRSARR